MNALRRLLPSGVKYSTVALVVDVAHGAVFTALVDELGRQDVAGTQALAILEHFLVDHREAIARLDVEHEVDVVLKDLGEFECDALVEVGIGRRLEQRTVDGRARGPRVDLERVLEHITAEALRVARDLQRFAVRQLALESHAVRHRGA